MYSIQFHELYHIIVADKAMQATKTGSSKTNDTLMSEITELFHNRNILILNEYPENEIQEKIEAIAIHAKQIEKLSNVQIQIQKI